MLDTIHAVQTPEGVELDLHVAGPVVRALAWLVDFVVSIGIGTALVIAVSPFGAASQGLMYIGWFLTTWFYPVAFEVMNRGRTPGKIAMGIRVVHQNGTPVGTGASVIRNFLRTVDFLPGFYALGLASACLDRSFRRLGDLAAGTIVIYSGREAHARPLPAVEAIPPPIPLTIEEQRAVIAFAERSPMLSPERADELAAIPEPLVAGGEPRMRLTQIAAWLLGGGRDAR